MDMNIGQMCRGCLKEGPDVQQSLIWPDVRRLFLDCTRLKIPELDILPQQLCFGCFKKCQEWNLFRIMCQENENILKSALLHINHQFLHFPLDDHSPQQTTTIKEEPTAAQDITVGQSNSREQSPEVANSPAASDRESQRPVKRRRRGTRFIRPKTRVSSQPPKKEEREKAPPQIEADKATDSVETPKDKSNRPLSYTCPCGLVFNVIRYRKPTLKRFRLHKSTCPVAIQVDGGTDQPGEATNERCPYCRRCSDGPMNQHVVTCLRNPQNKPRCRGGMRRHIASLSNNSRMNGTKRLKEHRETTENGDTNATLNGTAEWETEESSQMNTDDVSLQNGYKEADVVEEEEEDVSMSPATRENGASPELDKGELCRNGTAEQELAVESMNEETDDTETPDAGIDVIIETAESVTLEQQETHDLKNGA